MVDFRGIQFYISNVTVKIEIRSFEKFWKKIKLPMTIEYYSYVKKQYTNIVSKVLLNNVNKMLSYNLVFYVKQKMNLSSPFILLSVALMSGAGSSGELGAK